MVYSSGRWRNVVGFGLISLTLWSCHDKFMASSTRSKTSPLSAISSAIDAAGNVTGTIDPNSSVTQVLGFNSGALAGSGIAIPPGSLSLPLTITVGEGETLSSSEFLQDLGVSNNNLTAAGPSVAFIPSQSVEASNPLVLSIPFTVPGGLTLNEANENIVVLYRWTTVVGGVSSHFMGIIPSKEVTIGKDKVSFQTTKFGVFQLAKSETKIIERVNAQSFQPPAPKKDMSHPLFGTWGSCEGGAYFEEPIFENPRFAKVYVNPGVANFVLRGKNRPLSMKRYSDSTCNTVQSIPAGVSAEVTVPVRGYLADDSFLATQLDDAVYYKLEGSDSCQGVYPLVNHVTTIPFNFNHYSVSKGRIHLSWYSQESVTLTMHQDASCSGAGDPIGTYQTGGESSIEYKADVYQGLNPSTTYSFKLTDGDNAVCQNVMTTEIDVDDWSDGNTMPMPASTQIDLKLEREVAADQIAQYKLFVSIDGLRPVDTYSKVIKNGSADESLVSIPADEAGARVITVMTPPGCHFRREHTGEDNFGNSWTETFHDSYLSLPLRVTEITKVVCDGKSQDRMKFGGYPMMMVASKSLKLRITNGTYTKREDLFASRDCAEGTRVSSTVEVGEFVLPVIAEANPPQSLKGTTAIDVTPKELFGTMFSEAGVKTANNWPSMETSNETAYGPSYERSDEVGCGLKNWVIGERRNLNDTVCGQDQRIGVTKYNRVKLENTDELGERLYFCEIDDENHHQGDDQGNAAEDPYGHTPETRIPSCDTDETTHFFKRL
jgi:hypothetical protein